MTWTVLPANSQILAIHVALLSNGKILIFPGDQQRGSATDFEHARLFNPTSGLIEPCPAPTTDVFCSGHAFLGDGRIVVGGGTLRYSAVGHVHGAGEVSPFSGERSTWLYEPRANRWVRVGDMNFPQGITGGGGRWYPTLVALGNGEVVALSGHPDETFAQDSRHNNDTPERFSPSSGGWTLNSTRVLTGDGSGNGFFPRSHLLRDGRVFIGMHIRGTAKRMYDPYADQLVGPDIANTGIDRYDNSWDGPSVLLPLLPSTIPADNYRPRVLMACYQPKIIDLGATDPVWENTTNRVLGGTPNRTYACGVILPTAEVLICGGVSTVDPEVGVLQGEIYSPGIDWSTGAYSPAGGAGPQPAWSVTEVAGAADSAAVVRNYHSVAILMPDGRVWTGGSSKNADAGDPTDASIAELRMEIYSPNYVGQPRPTINSSPDYIDYGATFDIGTSNPGSIERVALIRCGSVTHAFDSDQRYVGLEFEHNLATNRLVATAPPHGNVAPPGQYMLWVVDSSDRPCLQAPILRLAHTESVVWTDRSSFSVHEVEAVLSGPGGSPAVFPKALYFVVEGHLPHEINAISATPTLTLHFDNAGGAVVPVTQMSVALNGSAMWEDPTQPADRPQRVTFAFDVRFPSAAIFSGIDNRQVWVEANWGTHRAFARLDLTDQPNPYMLDGPVHWLSTDVRVFRIRRGETKYGGTLSATETPLAFLQRQQAFYNTPAGEPSFRSIPEEQDDTSLTLFPTQGGQQVFNFAFAKVRYRALTAQAPNVAVFFRMFNTVGTAIEFNTGSTYARHEFTGGAIPLLGRQGSALISIPFFGESRVTPSGVMTDQRDSGNVHTLTPAGANEFQWHYGAYLDINQETQPHFRPSGTGNGPFGSNAQSIKQLLRDEHQCLVAEVYFKSTDPSAPPLIVDRATPGSSDKLSQRNLAFVRSANPGDPITRTVQHTFEVQPSFAGTTPIAPVAGIAPGELSALHRYKTRVAPDELMFVWGNLPKDAMIEIFLPAVSADDILTLLSTRPGPALLEKVDDHTVRCRIGDVTYVPIPRGSVNHAGLLSIELPAGVTHGQRFVVTAHQISGLTQRIIGAFQLQVNVRDQSSLLEPETRRLSLLRWIHQQMPATDRWRPVYDRYLGVIADRVDAFGGHSTSVAPSPNEDGSPEKPTQPLLCWWGVPADIAFAIALIAALPLGAKLPVAVVSLVLLVGIVIWQARCCRLTECQHLYGLLLGLTVGTAAAAIAALFGATGAWPIVGAGALASGIVAVVAVLRRCILVGSAM